MKCPYCAKEIRDELNKCPFCGSTITKAERMGYPAFYTTVAEGGCYRDPGLTYFNVLRDYYLHVFGEDIEGSCLLSENPALCFWHLTLPERREQRDRLRKLFWAMEARGREFYGGSLEKIEQRKGLEYRTLLPIAIFVGQMQQMLNEALSEESIQESTYDGWFRDRAKILREEVYPLLDDKLGNLEDFRTRIKWSIKYLEDISDAPGFFLNTAWFLGRE